MAKLDKDTILKEGVELLTAKQFSAKYADGVSDSAIYYAMDNNHIDYVILGRDKLVVMTTHTKQYKPNSSPARKVKKKVRRKKAVK